LRARVRVRAVVRWIGGAAVRRCGAVLHGAVRCGVEVRVGEGESQSEDMGEGAGECECKSGAGGGAVRCGAVRCGAVR
jgi:hypothetical protein